uniref:NADAR domain-containing protein n=1 Tax=Romanomermis culicivorax TaxID=13658 RepID=A0A915HK76_ROMCU
MEKGWALKKHLKKPLKKQGKCSVEDEEEPYEDSVLFHPHLEYETIAKQLGEQFHWSNTTTAWMNFASRTLYEASWYKYSQSKPLRCALLKMLDYELVETNPFDPYWGIRIRMDDPRIDNCNNWGANNFGKILIKLQDQMRLNVKFHKEAEPSTRFLNGQLKGAMMFCHLM